MKKISALVALLILSGCSTTSSVTEAEQLAKEEALQVKEDVIETVAPISLTVMTSPADARVRIMNIVPVYQAAMELEEGKYDVEVSKPGYLTYRKWIVLDKKTILTVDLNKAVK